LLVGDRDTQVCESHIYDVRRIAIGMERPVHPRPRMGERRT
jgi:hypothetical protein